jgi:hypothetical protein
LLEIAAIKMQDFPTAHLLTSRNPARSSGRPLQSREQIAVNGRTKPRRTGQDLRGPEMLG